MDDTSIAKVLTGPDTDFLPFLGVQHLSNGFLDQLPIAIVTFDREGRLVRYNRSSAELWGRAPRIGDATGPLDLLAEDVLRTRAPLRGREIVFERPDGRRVSAIANADLLFGEDGDVIGVAICLADVTAFKSNTQEGALSAHRLFDALPLAVYTTDAEGGITYYNQAAAEFWDAARSSIAKNGADR